MPDFNYLDCCAIREVVGIQDSGYLDDLKLDLEDAKQALKESPKDVWARQEVIRAQKELARYKDTNFEELVQDAQSSKKPFYIYSDNGSDGYRAGTSLTKRLREAKIGTVKVIGTKRNTTGSKVRVYAFMPDPDAIANYGRARSKPKNSRF